MGRVPNGKRKIQQEARKFKLLFTQPAAAGGGFGEKNHLINNLTAIS